MSDEVVFCSDKKASDLVGECIEIIKRRKDLKYKVVEIAIFLCEESKKHTYLDFCKKISLSYKTIWRWRKEYILIYKKVNKNELDQSNHRQIDSILGIINENTTKKQIKDFIIQQKKQQKKMQH